MKGKQLIALIILFLTAFSFANAQNKSFLKIVYKDKPSDKNNSLPAIITTSDSLSAIQILSNWVQDWRDKGYLAATVDSIYAIKDTIYSIFFLGKKYKWVNLSKGNIGADFLKQSGFKEKLYSNKVFSISEFKRFQNRLVTLSENRGNPFASLKLDSIEIEGENVKASLSYNPGPFISFDSLSIVGSAKVKPKFIARYFKIEKGAPYNRAKITEAERAIAQFPSIKVVRLSEIVYSNYKAYPIFFLNHRPANIIDGIVGFLPNEGSSRKLLITGQLNLNLYNIGGGGKDLLVEWNKLKALSQLLNFQFNNYNFIRSGLDLDTRFNLLKEDTTFINLVASLSLSKLLFNNLGRIKFSSEFKNSRVNSLKSAEILQDSVVAGFDLISYGIGYQWQQLDDFLFPRKGVRFSIDGLLGNKSIKENTGMDSSFYSDILKKTIQVALTTNFQSHFKLRGKSGIFAGVSAGLLFNDQLFVNDMFRIGGLRSLRGFNENNFFASKYALSNLEFRYFYEPESYFTLFYDQAYLKSEYFNTTKIDWPIGVGGGLNLKTNVGTLQIIYSLGKSKDQPFSFNYSRIHFGIINRF